MQGLLFLTNPDKRVVSASNYNIIRLFLSYNAIGLILLWGKSIPKQQPVRRTRANKRQKNACRTLCATGVLPWIYLLCVQTPLLSTK